MSVDHPAPPWVAAPVRSASAYSTTIRPPAPFIVRNIEVVSLAAVVTVLLVASWAMVLPQNDAAIPGSSAIGDGLLVTSLLLGLPHGAVDAFSPALTARGSRGWLVGIGAYAGLAVAVVAVWTVWPLWILLGLLLLSVLHFGVSDASASGSVVGRAGAVLGLGGIPVALPIALHPSEVRPILDMLSGSHGADVVMSCRVVGVAAVAAALVVSWTTLRDGQAVKAVEPVVLCALFAAMSPLVAFAVYFGLWHSPRQTVVTICRYVRRSNYSWPAASCEFLQRAALPSGVTAVAVVIYTWTGTTQVIVASLITVLALTVPHSICAVLETRSASPPAMKDELEPAS